MEALNRHFDTLSTSYNPEAPIGQRFQQIREKLFDLSKQRVLHVRNPESTYLFKDFPVVDDVSNHCYAWEFAVSPYEATLDPKELNRVAYAIANEDSQVQESYISNHGRFIKSHGLVFPRVITYEVLAQIDKEESLQKQFDPFGLANILWERDENLFNKDRIDAHISTIQLLHYTYVTVYPTTQMAQVLGKEKRFRKFTDFNDPDTQQDVIGLKPPQYRRAQKTIFTTNVNMTAPGDNIWVRKMFPEATR